MAAIRFENEHDATVLTVSTNLQDSQHAVLVMCGFTAKTLTASDALDLLDWLYSQRDSLYELVHWTQYKVALWPSATSVKPTFEMDVLAEDAKGAAILAMQANHTPTMGVVVVMSESEQEAFYDAAYHTGQNALVYSRTEGAARFTDKPFVWGHEKSYEEIETEIQEMNRKQDELW